jgi:hypothetical protein
MPAAAAPATARAEPATAQLGGALRVTVGGGAALS